MWSYGGGETRPSTRETNEGWLDQSAVEDRGTSVMLSRSVTHATRFSHWVPSDVPFSSSSTSSSSSSVSSASLALSLSFPSSFLFSGRFDGNLPQSNHIDVWISSTGGGGGLWKRKRRRRRRRSMRRIGREPNQLRFKPILTKENFMKPVVKTSCALILLILTRDNKWQWGETCILQKGNFKVRVRQKILVWLWGWRKSDSSPKSRHSLQVRHH